MRVKALLNLRTVAPSRRSRIVGGVDGWQVEIQTESDRPGLAMIKDALGLPGGLPIKVGNETIGGVGVAGAPGGNGDVACAEAAIEAVRDQLK